MLQEPRFTPLKASLLPRCVSFLSLTLPGLQAALSAWLRGTFASPEFTAAHLRDLPACVASRERPASPAYTRSFPRQSRSKHFLQENTVPSIQIDLGRAAASPSLPPTSFGPGESTRDIVSLKLKVQPSDMPQSASPEREYFGSLGVSPVFVL